MSSYGSLLILSAPIAVDTFLTITGFLTSLQMLKHFEKSYDINICWF